MELVCAGAFPGKTLEAGSFSDFVTQNNISRGFIAAGKGLTPADAQKAIKPDSKVYCLNSVSRKSSLVGQCGLLDFSAYLPEYDTVLYLKKNFDGKWLYSYRNPDEALREEKEWMRQAEKNNSYSFEAFSRKRKEFGTFFFESDIELPPEIPYIIFEKQAEIKMVMSSCNAVCGPDAAGMSDGGYIAGREFCVFMSSVLVFRLLKAFGTANLLADRTFGNLMSVLSCIRKTRINNGDWQLIRINSSQLKILEALKLSPAQGKASGKRGRPRDRKTRKQ